MAVNVLVPAKHVQARLNVSAVTLWRWRADHEGPRWCKLGTRVMYDAGDVDRFLADRFAEATPPTPAAA